jgi:hypothetical protein
MARLMSFSHTTEQIENRSKTVTRRLGWQFLEPGDEVIAVEKGQGLRKGERARRLVRIRIKNVRRERLCFIKPADVRREGFPQLTVSEFVRSFGREFGCEPLDDITRIEFEYLEDGELS